MKILIIGGGNMGVTYARSFLNSHIVKRNQLIILEKSLKKADELRKKDVGQIYGEPGEYINKSDLIILAVKPQDIGALFKKVAPFLDQQQVLMSIMAGVRIGTIEEGLKVSKIIRAMPNLPAQIGSGMTVFTSSRSVTRIELVMVQNLLNATGKTLYVEKESLIDAATAISGSGPAYVFYFMQSMIETARKMGFTQAEAELLSFQTFRGAVESFNKFDYSCEEWIERVTSRGGTTEAAFDIFKSEGLATVFKNGIHAALNRAEALSKS